MSGFSILLSAVLLAAEPQVFHAQGEMAGEVTQSSVILQSRLTSVSQLTEGDLPGIAGVARFELSERNDFRSARMTGWLTAQPENDFIVKVKVDDLKPATRYFYRLVFGADRDSVSDREGRFLSYAAGTCGHGGGQLRRRDRDELHVVPLRKGEQRQANRSGGLPR